MNTKFEKFKVIQEFFEEIVKRYNLEVIENINLIEKFYGNHLIENFVKRFEETYNLIFEDTLDYFKEYIVYNILDNLKLLNLIPYEIAINYYCESINDKRKICRSCCIIGFRINDNSKLSEIINNVLSIRVLVDQTVKLYTLICPFIKLGHPFNLVIEIVLWDDYRNRKISDVFIVQDRSFVINLHIAHSPFLLFKQVSKYFCRIKGNHYKMKLKIVIDPSESGVRKECIKCKYYEECIKTYLEVINKIYEIGLKAHKVVYNVKRKYLNDNVIIKFVELIYQ